MNWVHVDNLVLAHMLAAEALTEQRSYVSVSHYITWLLTVKTQNKAA